MKIRTRAAWALTAAGFALAAVVSTVTPAAASTGTSVAADVVAQPASTQETAYKTLVPAGGRVSCYGYYGTFLVGSHVMVVDWRYTSDECFGIATDRTIWHTWVGAGGWKRMGGNFHADDIETTLSELTDGSKGVVVWDGTVTHHAWYQRYTPPLGWTGEWTQL